MNQNYLITVLTHRAKIGIPHSTRLLLTQIFSLQSFQSPNLIANLVDRIGSCSEGHPGVERRIEVVTTKVGISVLKDPLDHTNNARTMLFYLQLVSPTRLSP